MKEGIKLEIIVDQLHVPTLLKLLEKAPVEGYTVIRGLTGSGERGDKDGEGLTGVFTNAMVIVACSPVLLPRIQSDLEHFLQKIGGVCMVSRIEWFG
jgi:PII-like signaling protein